MTRSTRSIHVLSRSSGVWPVALTGVLISLLGGCGWGGRIERSLHPRIERPAQRVVIFLVDGLPPRHVEQGSAAGWLPSIRRRFVDGGLTVQRATTSVPSITYAAILTILSGVDPAVHGIIGNRWFEPGRAVFRNYATISTYRCVNDDSDVRMLYERIQPRISVSIQAAHVRGVTHDISNWAVSGVMWFFGAYTAVDKLTASSTTTLANWASWHGAWPDVVLYYMPGLDTIGHLYGPDSSEFHRALRHVDYQIGRVCDWLESEDLLASSYVFLISDHGMVPVGSDGHIDLMQRVHDRWGRKATCTMLQDGPAWHRRAHYDRFDTVVNHQDGRRASIHLRSAAGWRVPPTCAEVRAIVETPAAADALWQHPGVSMTAYLRDARTAVLCNANGRSLIHEVDGADEPRYTYTPDTADVLGYRDEAARLRAAIDAGTPLPRRRWLERTAATAHPNIVPHIIPLLRHRRAGQVVLFARPGYSFVDERGGHGGIHRDEMLMTWHVAGPGIVPGTTVPTAQSIDIVPTILQLLDVDVEPECLPGTPLPLVSPTSHPRSREALP